MHKFRDPVQVCSRIGLGLFFMMLVWLVVTNVGSVLVMLYDVTLLNSAWVVWLVNDIPLYLLGLPVFLLVLRTIPDGPVEPPRRKTPVGPLRYLAILVFCLGATYIIAYAMNGLVSLLQMLVSSESALPDGNILDDLASEGGVLPNLIFGACVPALGEEFVFRYYLRRKMRGCSDMTYVVFSGLCFGLFHGNIVQGAYAIVLGMLLAWLYLATRNIWLPVTLHFFINLVGMVLAPLALESEIATMIFGLLALAAMVLAVVWFFRYRKHVLATMKPPQEPGWPYKPPKMPRQTPWKKPRWPADPADWQWVDGVGWQPVLQPLPYAAPPAGWGIAAGPAPAAAHGYPPYTGYITGQYARPAMPPPYPPQGYATGPAAQAPTHPWQAQATPPQPPAMAPAPVPAQWTYSTQASTPAPGAGAAQPPPQPATGGPAAGVYPLPAQQAAPAAQMGPAAATALAGQPMRQMGVGTVQGVGYGVPYYGPPNWPRSMGSLFGNVGVVLYIVLAGVVSAISLWSMLI
ncbi:MAG: CPBP family intramembrane metalloprotease [Ruminococcaceae bacterium]|nr:CPBP family intramembrane metalloprotease [Oscillospiraceae bacterium]